MSLVNMKELLLEARRQKRAVGAFSVSSVDMICGVIRAAEALDTPVILQVAQVRLPHSPLHVIGPAMLEAMRDTAVMKAAYDKLAPEVQQTKYPIGIFCDKTMPEYTEQYRKIQIMAGGIAE